MTSLSVTDDLRSSMATIALPPTVVDELPLSSSQKVVSLPSLTFNGSLPGTSSSSFDVLPIVSDFSALL